MNYMIIELVSVLSHLGVKALLQSKIKAKPTWNNILEVRRSSRTSRGTIDLLGESLCSVQMKN